MREIVTQLALAFILWSLAVELACWALQLSWDEQWWSKLLGQRQEVEAEQVSRPARGSVEPIPGSLRSD